MLLWSSWHLDVFWLLGKLLSIFRTLTFIARSRWWGVLLCPYTKKRNLRYFLGWNGSHDEYLNPTEFNTIESDQWYKDFFIKGSLLWPQHFFLITRPFFARTFCFLKLPTCCYGWKYRNFYGTGIQARARGWFGSSKKQNSYPQRESPTRKEKRKECFYHPLLHLSFCDLQRI